MSAKAQRTTYADGALIAARTPAPQGRNSTWARNTLE